ncbi:MAG: hypothetical protein WDN01_06255 [Rhizomicrobium sp.]
MHYGMMGIAAAAALGLSLIGAQAQSDPAPAPAAPGTVTTPSTVAAPAMVATPNAPSNTGAPGQAVAAIPPDPDADKMICKDMPPPTGSRLGGRRVCLTKAVWQEMTRVGQENVGRMQRGGVSGGSSR